MRAAMLQHDNTRMTKPTLGHVANITSAEIGGFIHVNPETIIGH